ncbi:site-specific integrase [Microvirga sp. 2MCAF38]|uniref:site-specific integrase n=1 Tax=Microvirga sp. 2MCAF38 TaxID=3232989 RepID=UPI003F9C6E4C
MKPRGSSYQTTVFWTPTPGNSRRDRRNFPTELEAKRWGLDSEERIKQGLEPEKSDRAVSDGKPRTVQEMADYVYEHYWKKQSGGEKQYSNAKEVTTIIGPTKQLSKIDLFTINKVKKALEDKGNMGSTLNRKLSTLRRCLNVAVDLQIIPSRPRWDKEKESEGRIARISKSLEARMLNWCERMGLEDIGDFILWSIHVGSRNEESLRIEIRDIDLETGVALFPGPITKSRKSRPVPLVQPVLDMVKRRIEEGLGPKDRLFGNLTKRKFDVQWAKMREHFDLEDDSDFVPHAMRHEFCSRMAERGASASYIMKVSGHKTLAVCQRYVHLFGKESDQMVRKFMQDAEPVSNVVAMDKALARKDSRPA